jgi:hypothetical protein
MRIAVSVLTALLISVIVAGCEKKTATNELPVWQSNKRLLEQKTELENKIRTLEAQNKQLNQQVETLGSLGKDVRLENLYDIQSINIVSSTGIYTKEKGQSPRLMVYFSPIDKTGDAIKAAGSVEIELWDIANKPTEALVGKWEIGPDRLKKDWGTALMSSFYRIAIDLPEKLPAKGDFIVRLSFTDYLSGKVLTARQAINKMTL